MTTKRIPISFSAEYIAEYEAIKDLPNRSNWICEAIREKLDRKDKSTEEHLKQEIERMNERIKRLEAIIADKVGIVDIDKKEVSNIKEKAKKGAKSLLD